jgi:hypothetical protein
LIENGYDAGLFSEGTQILVGALGVTPELWQKHMTPGRNDIDKILKGVIGVKPHLSYDIGKLPKFVDEWRKQGITDK